MSKVYKSDFVQMGDPRALKNNFKVIYPLEKSKMQKEAGEKEDASSLRVNAEAEANEIIEDAKQMYLKIINEANYEAERIKGEALQVAEDLRRNEQERGYEEGYAAGYREGRSIADSIIAEAEEIRSYLDMRRSNLCQELEEQVVDLLVSAARKVIGQELIQNKDMIYSLIRQALEKCAFRNKITIKVSPEDYDYVAANKNRIYNLVEGLSEFEIQPDASLSQGGCLVETPSGEINSSVEVQLKEMEKAFLYILRNE